MHRAFLNNQLIIAFEETMHNAYYTAPTNTFPEKEYRELADKIKHGTSDAADYRSGAADAKNAALTAKRGLSPYCGIGMQTI